VEFERARDTIVRLAHEHRPEPTPCEPA
jgi:hypothetical protein